MNYILFTNNLSNDKTDTDVQWCALISTLEADWWFQTEIFIYICDTSWGLLTIMFQTPSRIDKTVFDHHHDHYISHKTSSTKSIPQWVPGRRSGSSRSDLYPTFPTFFLGGKIIQLLLPLWVRREGVSNPIERLKTFMRIWAHFIGHSVL